MKCSQCPETDETQFSKKGDKFQPLCKACHKNYIRQHYQQNKEYYKDKAKLSNKKYFDWWVDIKNKLKCVECGESHIACLDFHHSDPEQKDGNIATMVYQKMAKYKILAELKKCVVLCANCHRKLHFNEKHCTTSA